MKLFFVTSLLVLLALTPTVRAAPAASSSSSPSDLSEWQHQAPVDALEFSPFYTSESEKVTLNPSSALSAGKKTGGQYGLGAEYGWLQSMTFGTKLVFANDSVSTTPTSTQIQQSEQTNGLIGFSVYTRGNADISFATLTYGLEFLSMSAEQLLTSGGINASQAGYEISPYLGLEFKLDGAVTGLRIQYGLMGDQALTNELVSPTTTQNVKGGNQSKGTLFYEENWSWIKLGVAATYLTSAATSDKTSGLTDNDQSTTLEGTVYFPLYLSDTFTVLPSADYASQSYSSSLSPLKSRTDLNVSLCLRLKF